MKIQSTRKCGTQESGYMTKQLLAAFQSEVLDEPKTDCHTKNTLEITLTNKNSKDFLYRYIVEGGKYVCLTPEVINNYVGKTVQLRSPMMCKGDKYCNICAGEMNYKLGNLNIGLGCSKISTTLQRLGMKKFHISNLASKKIDLNDIFI